MQSEAELTPNAASPGPGWFARRFEDTDWAGIGLKVLRIVGFYLALLGLWQFVYNQEIWSPYLLPSPKEVWEALDRYIENGVLQEAIKISMKRMFIGYSLSLAAGMIIGMLCGANKYVDETMGSLVLGLQSLPSITWLPLALLWFGLNDKAIIFVVFMGSVCAVAISGRAGIQGIPPLYKRAALTMGANHYQQLRYMLIPAMVPAMAQGLKLGWSFAWRSLMAAELLFVSTSLGHLLQVGRDLNNMSLVIAIMFVIVVIGLAADRLLFSRLEAWVYERWGWQSV